MANAAAKKAATARAATAKVYRPLLGAVNAGYLILRWVLAGFVISWKEFFLLATMAGLQVYAYMGILDSAATAPSSGKSEKALVGGASLDLLGLLMGVQFGSLLLSKRLYWLLLVLPIWGVYTLYKMFGGGGGGGGGASPFGKSSKAAAPTGNDEPIDDDKQDRRQKRADRRRQKRS